MPKKVERKFNEVINSANSPLPPTPSMRAVITDTAKPEINPVTWVISCNKIFRLIDNYERVSDISFAGSSEFFGVLMDPCANIRGS